MMIQHTNKKKFLKNIEARMLPYTVLFLLVAVVFSGLYIVLPPGDKNVRAATVDQFSYYKTVTLNHSQVPSTLTNFPVLVNLSSDADLASKALDSGYDIAFFNATDVQLNHEIELFNGTTGQLVAWVNVTTLAHDVDTVIKMYYNDSDIGSSAENIAGTWDSNYVAVWHMYVNATGELIDSTSYANHGTNQGSTDNPDSPIGYGRNFDGIDDYINIDAIDNDWSATPYSAEAYVNMSGNNTKVDGSINIINLYKSHYKHMSFRIVGSAGISNMSAYGTYKVGTSTYFDTGEDSIVFDNWYHVAVTIESGNQKIFLDGSLGETNNQEGVLDTRSLQNAIGGYGSGDLYQLYGSVSEVRISKSLRSNDWITTSANTIVNATDGGFFTLGDENGGGSGEYEISGLNVDTRFIWSGEAGESIWANATGATYETLAIHTNVSLVSDNCTDIFVDFGSLGIDSDITEEHINITVARNISDFTTNLYQVPSGGNVTINASVWDAQSWCAGDNPFPIVGENITIYVRARISIPTGKAAGTYTNASGWAVNWKVVT